MKWDNKQVLVTGGAGFLGMNLRIKLHELNAKIDIIDNFTSGGKASHIPGVFPHWTEDYGSFAELKEDYDYIFHLGTPSSNTLFQKFPRESFSSTTLSLINVLQYAKTHRVKKVICPSSGTVYGDLSPPMKETMSKPMTLYAVAKLACEGIASLEKSVPTVMLRIFTGYGPGESHKGQSASAPWLFLESILHNKTPIVWGDGSQLRDFIYVDDIVEIMLRAAESSAVGVFNLGTGESTTFNYIIDRFNLELNKDIKPRYVNKPVDIKETRADVSLMKNTFQFIPMSVEKGITKFVSSVTK